ncbi:hypothetical protein [Peribacillus butanolivorans]|uniref:hypothetical protein n=1 Tax=Peribacillus butanolivorans TaxID=421767 RepID=UPI001145DDAA|nr:hypothetical protein [Peribacillus butanolivorans]
MILFLEKLHICYPKLKAAVILRGEMVKGFRLNAKTTIAGNKRNSTFSKRVKPLATDLKIFYLKL